ncbi:MAG: hypothetical protein ACI9F2_000507 [Lysobacterales bacterium]|jgi:hypothetical protein
MDRDQQSSIYMVASVIGVLLIILVTWQIVRSNHYVSYTSPDKAFTIGHPGSWKLTEDFQGAAIVISTPLSNELDAFHDNITVVIQDLSGRPMSLKKYTETAVHQMKVVFESNLIILDQDSFYLSDTPGFKFVYIGKTEASELQIMNTWTIKDNIAYQVSYTALESSYEEFIDDAEKIIKSFKIN